MEYSIHIPVYMLQSIQIQINESQDAQEYVSSSNVTAVNYVSLSQNDAKTPIGQHSAIKVYECVE